MTFRQSAFSALCIGAALAAPAFAQDIFNSGVEIQDGNFGVADLFVNDVSVLDGYTCVGEDCSASEPFLSAYVLKLSSTQPGIQFNDTSTSTSPDNEWRLRINDPDPLTNGGIDRFAIEDATAGTIPFTIEAGAPDNAFWMNSAGSIGLGTLLPQDRVHAVDTFGPSFRFEQIGTWLVPPQTWRLIGQTAFSIADVTAGTTPIRLERAAPDNALYVDDAGGVGLGTGTPAVPLHIARDDGTASLTVENTGGDAGVAREMFKMASNGGSYFTLDNTGSGTTWYFVHENASPNRFIITDAVADGPEMTLTAEGVLTVPGGFVVGSTTLNVPDYVFAEDYALRPLSEVSRFITENGHLPDVPSASDVTEHGLDLTRMQLAQLQKIEELTLYILKQQALIDAQAERLARLEGLLPRD
ncbi:hypothetical protein [Tropicibacter sp. S64]|uniref:hypothetical protein n=1 Tax=Tropicibacter sp. S64 TaxID=3415122 RepID=UPI003C7D9522